MKDVLRNLQTRITYLENEKNVDNTERLKVLRDIRNEILKGLKK